MTGYLGLPVDPSGLVCPMCFSNLPTVDEDDCGFCPRCKEGVVGESWESLEKAHSVDRILANAVAQNIGGTL